MKIKKGDNVIMLSGKDRGKQGKVSRVLSTEDKIVVEGLNLVTKHLKPRKQGEKGQKIQIPRIIYAGKVMFMCPKCSKPTRIEWKREGEKKERVCKKCERSL